MPKISPLPSVPIALRVEAARIAVNWSVREIRHEEERGSRGEVLSEGRNERVFCPEVVAEHSFDSFAKITPIENPWELRNRLFKAHAAWSHDAKDAEQSALSFLDEIGAWRLEHKPLLPRGAWGDEDQIQRRTYADVSYGHRLAFGLRISPVTLDELKADIGYFYSRVKPLGAAAEWLKPPPATGPSHNGVLFASEAQFTNTLPLSLQWGRNREHPYAVVEPIGGVELMTAVAWVDVAGRLEPQVCARSRCGTTFTWDRKRKYCSGDCAGLEAKRNYKLRRRAAALAIIQQNRKKSPDTLLGFLEAAGVKRSRTWIGKQLAALESK